MDSISVNKYLGQLEPDELRILHEQLVALQATPEWQALSSLLRIDREQHVRMITAPKVLEHAEYAYQGGYVTGCAVPWGIFATVASTHQRVQLRIARDIDKPDGES